MKRSRPTDRRHRKASHGEEKTKNIVKLRKQHSNNLLFEGFDQNWRVRSFLRYLRLFSSAQHSIRRERVTWHRRFRTIVMPTLSCKVLHRAWYLFRKVEMEEVGMAHLCQEWQFCSDSRRRRRKDSRRGRQKDSRRWRQKTSRCCVY